MDDYYKILGIDRSSSTDVIKKSSQRLLLKHHPDKSTIDNSSDFIKIQEARATLLDVDKREVYDRQLKEQELEVSKPIYSKVEVNELEFDQETNEYFMECRCGGLYIVDVKETTNATVADIIFSPCTNCTFHLEITLTKK